MPFDPNNPEINVKVYDFCVRAFRSTRKLLKLNIKLHQDAPEGEDAVRDGDIFLFNHFARFETFIPQYLIHEACGAYCRSVAAQEFFAGDERFIRKSRRCAGIRFDKDSRAKFGQRRHCCWHKSDSVLSRI